MTDQHFQPDTHSKRRSLYEWMKCCCCFFAAINKEIDEKCEENVSCLSRAWLPVSCSPLQRKASTSWRFWFPAMRRGRSLGREVRPSSSCRKRLEPPSNCQNPKTSTPVSAHHRPIEHLLGMRRWKLWPGTVFSTDCLFAWRLMSCHMSFAFLGRGCFKKVLSTHRSTGWCNLKDLSLRIKALIYFLHWCD